MAEQGEHIGGGMWYSSCILQGVVESLFLSCAIAALCLKTYLGFHLAHFQAVEGKEGGEDCLQENFPAS